jgi:hypothetical protein
MLIVILFIFCASDSSDDGSGMYYRGKSKKHKIRKTKEASDSSDDGSGMYYRGKSKKHKIRKTKEASDSFMFFTLSSIIHTRSIIRGI